MEAYNRFNKCIFKYERQLFQLIGHDVFAVELKRNAISYSIYIAVVVLVVSEVYTLICYDVIFVRVFCMHITLFTVQVRMCIVTVRLMA